MDVVTLPDMLREYTFTGAPTLELEDAGIRYFVNEYWTSGQRQGAPVVVLTGGVRTPSDSLVGPVADQAIAALHFPERFAPHRSASVLAGAITKNSNGCSRAERNMVPAAR